jgi:hypothetical protein
MLGEAEIAVLSLEAVAFVAVIALLLLNYFTA